MRAMKRSGRHTATVDGSHLAVCRMYDGPQALVDGYAKSLWSAFNGPVSSAAATGLLVLVYVLPAAAVVGARSPRTRAIGMNSGVNALGQGNRANATIGRALQLVIRNVGGGRPGEIDRSTLGTPGKLSFCFAEAEDSDWTPLHVQRGCAPGSSAVTLFAGEGVQGIVDQKSRTPETLASSFGLCLRAVDHPKLAMAGDALLVVSPEHARVFLQAGWSKDRLLQELLDRLQLPGDELIAGAGGLFRLPWAIGRRAAMEAILAKGLAEGAVAVGAGSAYTPGAAMAEVERRQKAGELCVPEITDAARKKFSQKAS